MFLTFLNINHVLTHARTEELYNICSGNTSEATSNKLMTYKPAYVVKKSFTFPGMGQLEAYSRLLSIDFAEVDLKLFTMLESRSDLLFFSDIFVEGSLDQ